MPGNYDDKDLRSDAIVPPQPPSVRTITCYEVRPHSPPLGPARSR